MHHAPEQRWSTCQPADGPETGEEGVTLVEMLVVVGLMALIGIFMAGGLSAIRTALPMNAAMARSDEMALARDHLRQTLSEAIAQSLLRQDLYFEGDAERLGFVAAADPVFEAPGLVRVHLSAETVDGTLALVERRRIDRETDAAETGAAVLISGIQDVSFQYFRNGEAVSSIRKGEPLPDRVDVRIVFPPDDRRRFLPLEVRITCAFSERQI
jgi:type II secretory pathway component PulJ